jgi:ribosomal protein L12E/L44/L45/RPP1/RPP2
VLLDADPLHDITNTTRIDSVVVRGCLLDRAARERMLDDVLAAAQDPAAAAPGPMVCAAAEHTAAAPVREADEVRPA